MTIDINDLRRKAVQEREQKEQEIKAQQEQAEKEDLKKLACEYATSRLAALKFDLIHRANAGQVYYDFCKHYYKSTVYGNYNEYYIDCIVEALQVLLSKEFTVFKANIEYGEIKDYDGVLCREVVGVAARIYWGP